MKKIPHRVFTLVAFLLLMQVPAIAAAQENPAMPGLYDIPGFSPIRDYGSDSFDTIDPYNGNLKIVHTDMLIPQNGEIDLKIQRNYQPSQPGNVVSYSGGQGGGKSLIGVGWDIHFGRLWTVGQFSPSSTATGCRFPTTPSDRPVLELPDGSKQVLYISTDSDKAYMTQQRWIAKCMTASEAPEGGLVVISPAGLKYTFTQRGYAKYPSPTGQLAYVVSKIEDRNGNAVNFFYRLDNTSNIIRLLLLDYIDVEGGSHVQFTYEDPTFSGSSNVVGKNARLKYVDYASRRLEFSYADATPVYFNGDSTFNNGAKVWQLSQVKLSDGGYWKYEYVSSAADDFRLPLRAVVSPLNGRYEYTYQNQWVPAYGGVALDAANWRMVSQRVLKAGPSSSSTQIGAWQYQYSFSSTADALDTTNVISPVGCVQYKHLGNASLNNLWKVGTILEKTIFATTACSGALLERTTYTWDSQLISSDKQTFNNPPRVSAAYTYVPRLTNTQITRDGTTYTKTLSSFDNYGNPGRIVSQQAGQAAKTVDYTYDVKATPWIIHLLDREYYGINASPNVDRSYDNVGNLQSETVFGETSSYTYDNGEVKTHTDPDGKVTTFLNYDKGVSKSESRPEGISITRIVDSYGNITSETYSQLPSDQIPSGHSDASIAIGYTYDGQNRLKTITTPKSADSNFDIAYTFGSSNTRTITRGNLKVVETFDNFGNKKSVSKKDTSQTGAAAEVINSYDYDVLGRVTYEYSPRFTGGTSTSISYTYDALSRPKTIANSADTSSVSYAYQAGNKVAVTDEVSKVTTYSYRSFDNPDEKQLINIAAPEGQTTEINRNILGHLNDVKQGGVTHSYGYDNRMLLTTETRPEFGTITYGRDNRGNMTSRKVGASATTTYEYDGLGRLISITYPGTTTPDVTRIWYDKFGKPWQLNRGGLDVSRWDYFYDENGNLLSEVHTLTGAINKVLSMQHGYDALDQENGVTYPSGKVISAPRDALGRMVSMSQTNGIGSLVGGITYRPSGNFDQYIYGNSRTTTVTETARLWPKRFTVSGGGVADFEYAYTKAGDVSSITDYLNSGRTRAFGYDGLHRLSSVTGNGAWGNAAFSYSLAGDIKTKTIGSNAYTLNYDAVTNRVSSMTNAAGTQLWAYSYDNYGNVASKGAQSFFYDDSSNLIWDGTTAAPPNYAYDAHNRRYWQKDAAGKETLSLYALNGKLMYQEGKQDRSVRDYIYMDNTLVARMDYCESTLDSDSDGVPDCTEVGAGTNPDLADSSLDKDGDGLTNLQEYQRGTKINSPDSDSDGLSDGYEVANALNPLSSSDAHTDVDADGLDNYAEFVAGTNPRKADTDGDGVPDGQDTQPLLNIAAVLVPIIRLLLN